MRSRAGHWKSGFDEAIEVSRVDPTTYVSIVTFKYVLGILAGALRADAAAMHDTADALATAQRCSEDFALHMAQLARGMALLSGGSSDVASGFELLAEARSAAMAERSPLIWVPIIDLQTVMDRIRREDLDGAVELARQAIAAQFETGATLYLAAATNVLVESLVRRGRGADLDDAQAAIETVAAVPTDPGFALYELPLLRMRASLARVNGDEARYRSCADRYFGMAQALGFEGHLETAHAMK